MRRWMVLSTLLLLSLVLVGCEPSRNGGAKPAGDKGSPVQPARPDPEPEVNVDVKTDRDDGVKIDVDIKKSNDPDPAS